MAKNIKKVEAQKQILLNTIESLKQRGLVEFNSATIELPNDGRIGNRFALSFKVEKVMSDKSINTYNVRMTDFLLYNELVQLLRGYTFKVDNTFHNFLNHGVNNLEVKH